MRLSSLRFPLLAVALAVLAACLLLPGLSGNFVFDDRPNIIENTVLHVSRLNLDDLLYAAYSFQPGHGTRSLSMLSFALDYWRGDGLNPRVFKTTNLFIHVLTTFALALMLRRLLALAQWPPRRAAMGALVLAVLWAIHPLQVSSVLYVVQRMQTLVTLFMVLALWAYMGMRQAQMEGRRSRLQGVLTVLFWVLGFAAKEDALLLPLYTLALELTVLRFRAAQPLLATVLRRGYLWLAAMGVAVYLLLVVPHFWSGPAYPGRGFNTWERLLSQGRALAMYLGQMLWPLPSRLPFYYDDFAISRSLWQPATTLPAWLLLAALLTWAWRWRARRPLFAFGVLLFFAGHFMTSNVIGLELVFEHRNHLPLIGIVLALGDLAVMAWDRWHLPRWLGAALLTLVVAGEGAATVVRAHEWGDPLRFGKAVVDAAPHSGRAWLDYASIYSRRGGMKADSPDLARAIAISEEGAARSGSLALLSNVVVNKTIRGDVGPQDWARYLLRLRQVPMDAQNRNTLWTLLNNVDRGIALDREAIKQAIDIASAKWAFGSYENLRFGAFIYNETKEPGDALPYLHRAVALAPPDDPDIAKMFMELRAAGLDDWVRELGRIPRPAPMRR